MTMADEPFNDCNHNGNIILTSTASDAVAVSSSVYGTLGLARTVVFLRKIEKLLDTLDSLTEEIKQLRVENVQLNQKVLMLKLT